LLGEGRRLASLAAAISPRATAIAARRSPASSTGTAPRRPRKLDVTSTRVERAGVAASDCIAARRTRCRRRTWRPGERFPVQMIGDYIWFLGNREADDLIRQFGADTFANVLEFVKQELKQVRLRLS